MLPFDMSAKKEKDTEKKDEKKQLQLRAKKQALANQIILGQMPQNPNAQLANGGGAGV
jgi:hypothetical protein